VTEVAEHLDISRSGAHKHLSTLAELGYAEKNGTEYRNTVRFFRLGMAARSQLDIMRTSQDALDKLANIIGERVNVYTWRESQNTAVCVYTVSYRYNISGPDEGEEYELTTLPAGHVILAHCPPDVFATLDTGDHKRDELVSSLQSIRDRYIAFEIEEGVCQIAMPILINEKPIGSVEVNGPTDRLKGKRAEEDIPGMISSTVQKIERRLKQENT
jgi:DNA-binding IclR family transcriptional regulator